MQAAVIERPGNVILRKVPIPVVKAGEILVKMKAGALNPTATAFYALYAELQLPRPDALSMAHEPFLVWGGATSVGLYVIQLAKMSGYSVVTTCSPRSFDLVKSFGAEASYSYADPETPSRIPAAYPALRLALDCISSGGTTPLTSCSLGASSKYQKWVATLLSPQAGDTTGVDVHISRILSYDILGKEYTELGTHFSPSPLLHKGFEDWILSLPRYIEEGLRSNPLWVQEGGLAELNGELELLKQNKVSAFEPLMSRST